MAPLEGAVTENQDPWSRCATIAIGDYNFKQMQVGEETFL